MTAKARKSPTTAWRRDVFALFLFAKRFVRGASPRAAAKAAGVPPDAVRRAEERRPISAGDFHALCRWQGEDPQLFMERVEP